MFAAVCGILLKSCWLLAYLDTITTCMVLPGLVYFGFVLGAFSNRLLNLPISRVLASEGGPIASSGSWWAALLFGLLLLLQQQNRSDQTEKHTAANTEVLVFSSSLLLHFALHAKYIRAWNRNCGTEPLLCYEQGDDISWEHSCGLSLADCTVNFFLQNFI